MSCFGINGHLSRSLRADGRGSNIGGDGAVVEGRIGRSLGERRKRLLARKRGDGGNVQESGLPWSPSPCAKKATGSEMSIVLKSRLPIRRENRKICFARGFNSFDRALLGSPPPPDIQPTITHVMEGGGPAYEGRDQLLGYLLGGAFDLQKIELESENNFKKR